MTLKIGFTTAQALTVSALLMAGCSTVDGTGYNLSPDTTQSIALADPRPSDDPVAQGKEHYRRKDYGLAEKSFRAAVEVNPRSVDAWVGLAASYDRLRRFDLAEQAYDQVIKLAGRTPEVLNNLGYHYLLKGDRQQARRHLQAAAEKDPNNTFVLGNLRATIV